MITNTLTAGTELTAAPLAGLEISRPGREAAQAVDARTAPSLPANALSVGRRTGRSRWLQSRADAMSDSSGIGSPSRSWFWSSW